MNSRCGHLIDPKDSVLLYEKLWGLFETISCESQPLMGLENTRWIGECQVRVLLWWCEAQINFQVEKFNWKRAFRISRTAFWINSNLKTSMAENVLQLKIGNDRRPVVGREWPTQAESNWPTEASEAMLPRKIRAKNWKYCASRSLPHFSLIDFNKALECSEEMVF